MEMAGIEPASDKMNAQGSPCSAARLGEFFAAGPDSLPAAVYPLFISPAVRGMQRTIPQG